MLDYINKFDYEEQSTKAINRMATNVSRLCLLGND